MSIKLPIIPTNYWIIFIIISLFSCNENVQPNEDCAKFENEQYTAETEDTALISEGFKAQKRLLGIFGDQSVKGLNYEAYYLQFYSSFSYGKSVKFESRPGGYTLTVKCKNHDELLPDCEDYYVEIDKEEWQELENMIYEFNFWTTEDFRKNEGVLDGYAFFLEGNRPEAQKCHKKSYKLVGRSSPRYDKMGALCENILSYEKNLMFRYEELNKIQRITDKTRK